MIPKSKIMTKTSKNIVQNIILDSFYIVLDIPLGINTSFIAIFALVADKA